MKKLLSLCAFLSCSASLLACAEEKDPPPTHAELCGKNIVSQECLAGKWYFNGIEEDVGSLQDNSTGSLELKKDGEYSFSGGVYEISTNGRWTLDVNKITVDCVTGCDDSGVKSATITLADSSRTMRAKSSKQTAAFSFFASNSIQFPIEKFTWSE